MTISPDGPMWRVAGSIEAEHKHPHRIVAVADTLVRVPHWLRSLQPVRVFGSPTA